MCPPQPRPGPPNPSLLLSQPRPPVSASRHSLWPTKEGVVPWPPPALENGDVSPRRWGTGLLGHAHMCQESRATTCMFMELVRRFWGAALGGGPGVSEARCGRVVIVASSGPGTSTDVLRMLCPWGLAICLSLYDPSDTFGVSPCVCVGVCTHVYICRDSLCVSAGTCGSLCVCTLISWLVCICI